MKACNLVLSLFFKASVSVTLYECPWHPYIESTDALRSVDTIFLSNKLIRLIGLFYDIHKYCPYVQIMWLPRSP